PVLKHLAGEDIDVVLKRPPRVRVDVDAQDVERILVNVAAYARERIRVGGRLTIDAVTVSVDREFSAQHPHVGPGSHLLMTVTGERCEQRWDRLVRVRASGRTAGAELPAAEKPGVDLGAVQSLIRDCGGHLWMAAQPAGDMVLKIYLPLSRGELTGRSQHRRP